MDTFYQYIYILFYMENVSHNACNISYAFVKQPLVVRGPGPHRVEKLVS